MAGGAGGTGGAGGVRLPRSFYDRPALDVARDLIGKVLVHTRGSVVTSGVIVEVEAYRGESDAACHAACGPTPRNAPLYGLPGFSYVYLNYGIHCLVNAVVEPEGSPAAVLIRALEPLEGIAIMRRRRGRPARGRRAAPRGLPDHALCRGPGNLTCAMGITLAENRLDLLGDRLSVQDRGLDPGTVDWSPRIGIRVATGHPWRASVRGHPAVSGPRATAARPTRSAPASAARAARCSC
ncbi:MAG: DNA-3-methyladenine glycosylase [Acidobacteria bacterium]|nr:DNA-3-methyladenine glycosylase [Acidobacteriota bacterium]